jgi:hypothetical protein
MPRSMEANSLGDLTTDLTIARYEDLLAMSVR